MTYEVTAKHKKIVEDLAACGVPQEIIADSIDLSVETMLKYYGGLWREGRAGAIAGAGKMLYKKVIEGDNASLFFYLKTQAGYKETNVEEKRFVDKDGKDLHTKDKEILRNEGINIE